MKQSPYQLLMGVVLLGTVAFFILAGRRTGGSRDAVYTVRKWTGEQKQAVVVIDPGHGGHRIPGNKGSDRSSWKRY